MSASLNENIFLQFPTLTSERLRFRAFEKSDAANYFSIRTNAIVMKYMDSPMPENLTASENKIEAMQQEFLDKKSIQWVITEKTSGEFLGYFGYGKLDRKNFRGEIGYAILPQFWGKGYMGETLKCLINFAFQEFHLHSIEANVNPENENSKKLLRKFGFQQEAYFRENYFFDGQFLDSAIFCLLGSDFKG